MNKMNINNSIPKLGLMVIALALCFSSCRNYLDVVPDNVLTIDDMFASKQDAYNALAKTYSYLPFEDLSDVSSWLLGDEYIGRTRYFTEGRLDRVMGVAIMRGLQGTSRPLFGIWGGSNPQRLLDERNGLRFRNAYEAIAVCNTFIDNIDHVPDMSDLEKTDWKAQVKFMKAYYHFMLLRQYGPIVISDKLIRPDSPSEEIFASRSKVDDCFNYIVSTMTEAIKEMQERRLSIDLGQIDKIGAASIKARVLVYRASPFYSGNSEYYGDFLDHDGQPFFPVNDDAATTKQKWKDAVDAIDEALELCQRNGVQLYTFDKPVYLYDEEDMGKNERLKTYWDLRMIIADPWNKELIWAQSNVRMGGSSSGEGFPLQAVCGLMLPVGYTPGTTNNTTNTEQWMGATNKLMHRYYTKNGLPLNVDASFNTYEQYSVVETPSETDDGYNEYIGIMQPGVKTARIYMDRELRFYANLGITGGYWRQHGHRISTSMFRSQTPSNFTFIEQSYPCGIGIQKLTHPETNSGDWRRMMRFPYPFMRLADLYLLKAEAMNEYLDAPNESVYEYIDYVRARAGIPSVKKAWEDIRFVREEYRGYHLTKEGMRDIILQERGIELSFEGHRFWDMIRHKRAVTEFSQPIFGWDTTQNDAEEYFVLQMVDERYFKMSYCLWPIWNDELDKNSKIIQNPGW